jgi:dTDP-4-dehydrorhamnose reductase
MRILVTGAQGQLGRLLVSQLSDTHEVVGVDLQEMDITDRLRTYWFVQEVQPSLVIHAAALTQVDYCAQHPDEALRVNAYGTQHVALACQRAGAELLYVSTNEVFDGANTNAYLEYDLTRPTNPYGYSKWVGEQMVRDVVPRHYIVRTSWLFAHGGRNFIHAILNRAASGQPLRVVVNEVSTPTYTTDLADAICRLIETHHYGIYHLVNEGRASRWAFARHILDITGYRDTPIERISAAEYPRPSRPPEYAVLRNFAAAQLGIVLRPWQEAVEAFCRAENILAPAGEES